MDHFSLYYLLFLGVYLIVIILPTLLVKREKWTSDRTWDTVIYLIMIVIVSVLPFLIKLIPSCKDSNELATFVLAALISVIGTCLKYYVDLIRDYKNLKAKFESQINIILDNPILKTKQSLDSVTASLFGICNHKLRSLVHDFVIESLEGIEGRGAVQINATFSDYTMLLGKFMKTAKSVIGTFTSRPKEIEKLTEEECFNKYLNILKNHKSKVQRICVLEKKEIIDIQSEDWKSNEGLSEVEWFLENVPSNGKTKWAETQSFLQNIPSGTVNTIIPERVNKMVDFAIFDDVLLRWSPDENYSDGASLTQIGCIVVIVGEKTQELKRALMQYMISDGSGYHSFDDLFDAFQK